MNEEEQAKRVEAYCIKICKTIKERRKKLNLSQSDVSERSGISLSTIRRIENYKTTPDLITLLKLLDALDMEFESLVKKDEVDFIAHSILDLDINQLFRLDDFVGSCIKMKTEKEGL
ncbi:MAG: helix-turn-helix transcriptional regulator [Lachnospiraceae bacterium]|nr:helix-turn-helix transcriptional regulator [Lachnospiraceae bacterium]